MIVLLQALIAAKIMTLRDLARRYAWGVRHGSYRMPYIAAALALLELEDGLCSPIEAMKSKENFFINWR